MAVEVEIKAWVKDMAEMARQLERRCAKQRDFCKEDAYFHSPLPQYRQDFRVRRDGDTSYCTFKEKDIQDDLEVNKEEEFVISDAGLFIELMEKLGCIRYAQKKKKGCVYSCGDIRVELCTVEPVGDFIEVEVKLDGYEKEREEKAKRTIRSFLRELGVLSEDIENRTYSQLITEKKNSC
jgi:adenylate cyclase class 2